MSGPQMLYMLSGLVRVFNVTKKTWVSVGLVLIQNRTRLAHRQHLGRRFDLLTQKKEWNSYASEGMFQNYDQENNTHKTYPETPSFIQFLSERSA